MFIRICDRCKEKIGEDENYYYLNINEQVYEKLEPTYYKFDIDLCKKCKNEIVKFIEGK